MENKHKILCVADAHILETPGNDGEFFDMLGKVAESEYDIIFLGDIFELWIAFNAYEADVHRKFLDWCRKEKTKRQIGFIEGNHEFYVSSQHADAFTWATDRSHELAKGKVCLMHGDTINEDDFGYRLLRAVLRNPLSRFIVWIFGPLVGKMLSEKIRLSLKNKNLQHKKNFPEKYFGRMADKMESDHVNLCVLGHFHKTVSVRGINVLPAWNPDGEVGVYDPETEKFAIRSWKKVLNAE